MIILLGSTGAGKSVQAEIIAKKHNLRWISAGNLLRKTNDPKVINPMKAGKLVDNELVNEAIKQAILETKKDRTMILDGFPRSVEQAKWLVENLKPLGREIEHVIVLNVTKEEVVKRLEKRHRLDDTKEAIYKRWDTFIKRTKPVIKYFQDNLETKEVDGIGSIEEVTERIESALGYKS